MNYTHLLLLAIALCAVTFLLVKPAASPLIHLANVAGGAYEFGVMTRTAEVDFTSRYLLGQKGAADGSVILNAADSAPLYIVEDERISGDVTACAVLGNASGIRTVIGSGVIVEGEDILTDAGGKVQSEANAAAGDYFRVGSAMSSATDDGEEVFIAHIKPVAVTIA